MLAKWIDIEGKWGVVVNYDVQPGDLPYILAQVDRVGVSGRDRREIEGLFDAPNRGFTVSDMEERMSLTCIGWADSREQMVDTIIHEIDHVQRDVCEYYGVSLGSERAAWLQGYLGREMMVI